MAATLILEDGTSFEGQHFGAAVSVPGEVGKWLSFFHLLNSYLLEIS